MSRIVTVVACFTFTFVVLVSLPSSLLVLQQ